MGIEWRCLANQMERARRIGKGLRLTLVRVDPHHNDDFIPSYTNQLLNGSYPTPGQFRKQNHSFDVIVLELIPSKMQEPPCNSHRETKIQPFPHEDHEIIILTDQLHISTHLRDLLDLNHNQLIFLSNQTNSHISGRTNIPDEDARPTSGNFFS